MKDRQSPANSLIRQSSIAGSFYPGRADDLSCSVGEMLRMTGSSEVKGELVALISPHAGLRFSGPVAAAGYRLLDRYSFDTAVLIGPSHYVHFDGASVYARGAFDTPLGRVPVDEELATDILAREMGMSCLIEAHAREHSLEMQLPFLQILAPEIHIVPIVMGAQHPATIDSVAKAVGEAVLGSSRRIILIASSDLSHFKPAELAGRMDGQVSAFVERFDPEGLQDLVIHNQEHACGGGPMVAVMKAARALGAVNARVLCYGDSGDITGDKSEVVGYLSAGLFSQ